jgi:hypothetical protein
VDHSCPRAEPRGATTLGVLDNDTDIDTSDELTVTAVTQPNNGAVTLSGGVVRFTPAANFVGSTTFTYTVSDGSGGLDTATVNVTVTPVNDPPDAVNDSLTVAEDSSATSVNVLANDTTSPDTGETLAVSEVTQPPTGGSVTLTGGVGFTPTPNFHGATTFTYTVSDGNGGTDTASVNVTVTPVNDAPTAVDDSYTVPRDSGATVLSVLSNDSSAPDTGETLTVTAVTQPSTGGSVTFTSSAVTFTPTTGFTGTSTFTYTVSDGNGGTATASVVVTVGEGTGGPNNPPTANNDSLTVAEDSGATVVDVLANDSSAPDAGETLSVTAVTQPVTGGSVSLTGGVVEFTPTPNFNGSTAFTYTVSDGNGGTDTASVNVTVTSVNDPPDAVDDAYTVPKDSVPMELDVRRNDSSAPDTGETLTVTAVTQPATGGSVTLVGGVVRFTPTVGFTGTSTFTYTISDGNGGTDTATVFVTVSENPANNPPTANNDTYTVAEDSGATTLRVLDNDSTAPDTGETLTVTSVTQPTVGGAVMLTGGVVSFTPAANFNGTAVFTYTVSDGREGTATASVSVTVTPVNDPPDAMDDTFRVAKDSGAMPLNVLFNDSSAPDTGETLTVSAVTQPVSGGSVSLTDNVVRFTPAAGFTGTSTFTYTISDGNGGSDTANVTVVISTDLDGDGLDDELETATGTNPQDDDTDDDGLRDGTEDSDRDGTVDPGELDPRKSDSDDDGLSDGLERSLQTPEGNNTSVSSFTPDADPSTTTDPLVADTDGDALKDGEEDANHNGRVDSGETDPNSLDTDGGGVNDGAEAHSGRNPLDESDDYMIVGNGCASAGTSQLLPELFLGLAFLLRRWKAGSPRRISRVRRAWLPVVMAILGTTPMRSQAAPTAPSREIDVQQYKPGPGIYDLMGLHSAQVGSGFGWNLGLSVNYAKNPLTVLEPGANEVVYKLVAEQLTVDVMGAISFLDHFELGLALPVTTQSSQREPAAPPLFGERVDATGVGDLRLVPKASLKTTGGWSLGAALPVHLPTAGSGKFLGGEFSFRPRVLGEWVGSGGLRVLANAGLNLRSPQQQFRSLVVANELTYGLGTEVPFRVGAHTLSVGGSLIGALGIGQEGPEERPLELMGSVKYQFTDGLAAHLGGGPGLTLGYGTPRFRLFAGVAWSG